MSAPFCTACGATVADGTRFCVKCGQPVGHAAPPANAQTTVLMPPPAAPPLPPPVAQAPVWTPPPPPPPPPLMQPPVVQKEGPGAGLWIGIFGILLLLGGAGLWFYTTRGPGAHGVLTAAQDTPTAGPTVSPTPAQPTPTPTSTFVPTPTPNPETEVIPPNPDQAQKDAAPTPAPRQPAQPRSQPTPQPAQTRPAISAPPPQSDPEPAPTVRAARQTSGVLHASVEVAQNGEVVFENLPGARLKFTFDHSAWQPTITHQSNGTQTLVMRSLKPGIQRTCDVQWEIIQ